VVSKPKVGRVRHKSECCAAWGITEAAMENRPQGVSRIEYKLKDSRLYSNAPGIRRNTGRVKVELK
jgi:hypothetical protein